MIVHDFSNSKSLLRNFELCLRDKNKQSFSPAFFRKNLERIAEIFAYEISKTLNYEESLVSTVFSEKKIFLLKEQVIVASILRAGLPFHQGFLNYYDQAVSIFLTPFTAAGKDQPPFIISRSPINLEKKVVLLVDPMLATGGSMLEAYQLFKNSSQIKGSPVAIHLVCVVASELGVEKLKSQIQDDNVHLWIMSLDSVLNDQGYIVPGLGDAGDLSFGYADK